MTMPENPEGTSALGANPQTGPSIKIRKRNRHKSTSQGRLYSKTSASFLKNALAKYKKIKPSREVKSSCLKCNGHPTLPPNVAQQHLQHPVVSENATTVRHERSMRDAAVATVGPTLYSVSTAPDGQMLPRFEGREAAYYTPSKRTPFGPPHVPSPSSPAPQGCTKGTGVPTVTSNIMNSSPTALSRSAMATPGSSRPTAVVNNAPTISSILSTALPQTAQSTLPSSYTRTATSDAYPLMATLPSPVQNRVSRGPSVMDNTLAGVSCMHDWMDARAMYAWTSNCMSIIKAHTEQGTAYVPGKMEEVVQFGVAIFLHHIQVCTDNTTRIRCSRFAQLINLLHEFYILSLQSPSEYTVPGVLLWVRVVMAVVARHRGLLPQDSEEAGLFTAYLRLFRVKESHLNTIEKALHDYCTLYGGWNLILKLENAKKVTEIPGGQC